MERPNIKDYASAQGCDEDGYEDDQRLYMDHLEARCARMVKLLLEMSKQDFGDGDYYEDLCRELANE